MQKLRQVICFHCQGKGTKSISKLLEVSRNTSKRYLQTFYSLGISYEEFSKKNDSELSELFFASPQKIYKSSRYLELESLLPRICKQLKRKGITRDMLHKEYLEHHPGGYGRSRFNSFIQIYLGQMNPVMHIDHKAGDKLYIDFAGKKLHLTDEKGEQVPVEVFLAVLGCSQLTYVEAVASQRREDLIKACENSLLFYGGVPQVIVPDNLRSAVTKGSKYEAIINPEFALFAEHYGTIIIPARAYKPRDKSLVEGAVKLVYSSIYTKLEREVFRDLESINIAIRVLLEDYNNAFFSKRDYSRMEQFEEIEKMALGKLNPIRYKIKVQVIVTVMKNAHVRLAEDIHYYSVPYIYIGKKVKILYTTTDIEIFYRYELIAKHTRSKKKYQYTTNPEHLATKHQFVTEWSPEKFITQASAIHENVASYIGKIPEHKPYPEQAYKSCSGILSFARRVGEERLIDACRWADSLGQYSYLIIEEILNKKLDKLKPEAESVDIPSHNNIRGEEYYK